MSNCHCDCSSSSMRIDRAYSLQGLKSRPNECRSTTLLASAAATLHPNNIIRMKSSFGHRKEVVLSRTRYGLRKLDKALRHYAFNWGKMTRFAPNDGVVLIQIYWGYRGKSD